MHIAHSADNLTNLFQDTAIIPGLMLTFLSEPPDKANGSTLIRMYLAARSCMAQGVNRDKLELRSNNEISKMCNALVRGMRHGLCGWINLKADQLHDDSVFSGHVQEIFDIVAKSPNTDFVCTLLRAARALQNKTPTQIHKAVDTSNGTVQVLTYEVKRSVWSRIIGKTIDVLTKHLLPWFGNVEILNLFLDPRNALVFSTDPHVCKVMITRRREDKTEEFKLANLITDFGSAPQHSFTTILVHLQIAMSYLSFGALRGTEIERIPKFDKFQFLLNRLTFQVSKQSRSSLESTSQVFFSPFDPLTQTKQDIVRKGHQPRSCQEPDGDSYNEPNAVEDHHCILPCCRREVAKIRSNPQ